MNKSIGLQLVIYSLLLAGLGNLPHRLVPDLAQTTLITGWVGGVFCLIWGVRALGGHGGKPLPILTLVLVNFFLLSQTVMSWWGGSEDTSGRRAAALLITFLLLLSMGMLLRIVYAGLPLDGRPDRAIGKPEAGSHKKMHSTA